MSSCHISFCSQMLHNDYVDFDTLIEIKIHGWREEVQKALEDNQKRVWGNCSRQS